MPVPAKKSSPGVVAISAFAAGFRNGDGGCDNEDELFGLTQLGPRSIFKSNRF